MLSRGGCLRSCCHVASTSLTSVLWSGQGALASVVGQQAPGDTVEPWVQGSAEVRDPLLPLSLMLMLRRVGCAVAVLCGVLRQDERACGARCEGC
eukprot:108376-Rhodomonas_salina.1